MKAGQREEQERAEMVALLPAENMALTIARSMVTRGDNPGPNVTAVLVMALDRLTGRQKEPSD